MAKPSLDLDHMERGRFDGNSRFDDTSDRPRSTAVASGSAPCGEIGIRIARDGTWFYHDSPISRKPLVQLFASVLARKPDGSYWLVTPAEQACIHVEDAPFVAVELSVAGAGRNATLSFRTNLDETVAAGPHHPIRVVHDPATAEPSPYVTVRPGLDALIARPVYYELVAMGEEAVDGARRVLGVWSGGRFFVLGPLDGDGA
jgi:uncharacterized protein